MGRRGQVTKRLAVWHHGVGENRSGLIGGAKGIIPRLVIASEPRTTYMGQQAHATEPSIEFALRPCLMQGQATDTWTWKE